MDGPKTHKFKNKWKETDVFTNQEKQKKNNRSLCELFKGCQPINMLIKFIIITGTISALVSFLIKKKR